MYSWPLSNRSWKFYIQTEKEDGAEEYSTRSEGAVCAQPIVGLYLEERP